MATNTVPMAQRVLLARTDLLPCCLRSHPNDSSILVIGTYELNKDNGCRSGSIEVFKMDNDELIKISSYKTSGAILDIKFSPFDNDILLSCHSTGNVMVWDCKIIETGTGSIDLSLVCDKQLFDLDILVTSLNFSSMLERTFIVTLTSGEVLLVKLTKDGLSDAEVLPQSHSLECWTASFGSSGPLANVVFSGGDDCALIAHDIRDPQDIIFNASRIHDAGVVAIMPSTVTHNGIGEWNTSRPYDLWTGSYDDCLRTLDLRVMSPQPLIPGMPPIVKQKINLGGGVWRLIPSPVAGDDRLLTCCMYDGARIMDVQDGEPVVKRYFKKDHESMCYGGDWSITGDYVTTCSFYDNVVQVWSPTILE